MADTKETSADIFAEMRGKEFDDPHLDRDGIIGARRLARGWADRLEAAIKRERVDAAKLREACETLMSEIGGYSADGLEVVWCGISGETIKKARAALATISKQNT